MASKRSTSPIKPVRNPETAPDRTRAEAAQIAERRIPMAKWTERNLINLAWRGPERARELVAIKRVIVESAERFCLQAVVFPGSYREPKWQLVRFFKDLHHDGWLVGVREGYGIAWICPGEVPGTRFAVVYSLLSNRGCQADPKDLVWMEVPPDSLRANLSMDVDDLNAGIKSVVEAVHSMARESMTVDQAAAYWCERDEAEQRRTNGRVRRAQVRTAPERTERTLNQIKATIINAAQGAHRKYPQYKGHWQSNDWRLVEVTADITTKMGLAFQRGTMTVARPDSDSYLFVTAYSLLNQVDTSIRVSDVIWLEPAAPLTREQLIERAYGQPCGVCERYSSDIYAATGDLITASMLIAAGDGPGRPYPWPLCLGCYLNRPFDDRSYANAIEIIDGDPGADCPEQATGFGTCWRTSESGRHLHLLERAGYRTVFAVRASGEQFEIVGRIMSMDDYLDAMFGPDSEA